MDSATPSITFATDTPLALEAAFDGGRLTSDGGLPWLADAEEALGLLAVFAWYVDRGEAEHWIKDFKLACFADRLSCHSFAANQFRLLLHAAAYSLLDTLRRWLIRR